MKKMKKKLFENEIKISVPLFTMFSVNNDICSVSVSDERR